MLRVELKYWQTNAKQIPFIPQFVLVHGYDPRMQAPKTCVLPITPHQNAWEEVDSNHRKPKLEDLQSSGINHYPILPIFNFLI